MHDKYSTVAAGELVLQAVGLEIHGQTILSEISFRVRAGETLGIIGESGSGKSMTALSIMQLLPHGAHLSGAVMLGNTCLSEQPEPQLCHIRGRDIGMVFQEPMTALNPVQSIGAQVAESIRLHRDVSHREAWSLAAATLRRVGLPPERYALSRYPHELSGGQRQRVVIAIAVACQPRLLIADEPTTALDVTTQADILRLLKDLQQKDGMSLILITHDLAVVSEMTRDVLVMRNGCIVEHGELNTLFHAPQHDYTRMLFRTSALIDVDGASMESVTSEYRADTDSENTVNASAQPNQAHIPVVGSPVSEQLLTASHLVCEYPLPRQGLFDRARYFRAVDDVSFSIQAGESVGLVGESGCGKSTLSRALLGLMPLHSGTVELCGEAVVSAQQVSRAARRRMQVVFQDPYGSFNPRHRVQRLVSEPLYLFDKGVSSREKIRRVAAALVAVGLSAEDADKYIHEFSGGQRQRIAIARALIVEPRLLILDEAVSALDVSVRALVLELLSDLAVQKGLAYLFISHDLSVVRQVTQRVLIMHNGKLLEQGPTQDVFTNPQHSYTQSLIAAVPRLRLGGTEQ